VNRCRLTSGVRLTTIVLALLGELAPAAVPATEIVDGDIQGWKYPYEGPEYSRDCQRTQRMQARCAREAEAHSRRYMEDLVQQIVKPMPATLRHQFNKAQDLWLAFRDASCAFEAAEPNMFDNSTIRTAIQASCANTYNQVRIELLSKYYHCKTKGPCSSDISLSLLMYRSSSFGAVQ
jgi:uncharacterized protein YecT (DUF1311 family)